MKKFTLILSWIIISGGIWSCSDIPQEIDEDPGTRAGGPITLYQFYSMLEEFVRPYAGSAPTMDDVLELRHKTIAAGSLGTWLAYDQSAPLGYTTGAALSWEYGNQGYEYINPVTRSASRIDFPNLEQAAEYVESLKAAEPGISPASYDIDYTEYFMEGGAYFYNPLQATYLLLRESFFMLGENPRIAHLADESGLDMFDLMLSVRAVKTDLQTVLSAKSGGYFSISSGIAALALTSHYRDQEVALTALDILLRPIVRRFYSNQPYTSYIMNLSEFLNSNRESFEPHCNAAQIDRILAALVAADFTRYFWGHKLNPTTYTLKLDKTSETVGYASQLIYLTVTSNANWTASSDQSFITVANTSGSGNGTVTVRVGAQPSGATKIREGNVIFTYNNWRGEEKKVVFKITQDFLRYFTWEGGTIPGKPTNAFSNGALHILTNHGDWSIVSHPSWMEVSDILSFFQLEGNQRGYVIRTRTKEYNLTGNERTGYMTIERTLSGGARTTSSHLIRQAQPSDFFYMEKNTLDVPAGGGDVYFDFYTDQRVEWSASDGYYYMAQGVGGFQQRMSFRFASNIGKPTKKIVITFRVSSLNEVHTMTITQPGR